MPKVVLGLSGVIALSIAALYAIGARLPVRHVAAVRVTVAAPIEEVFAAIRDVAAAPTWRSGLEEVENYASLNRYGRDLARRFGDDAPVERLS